MEIVDCVSSLPAQEVKVIRCMETEKLVRLFVQRCFGTMSANDEKRMMDFVYDHAVRKYLIVQENIREAVASSIESKAARLYIESLK